MPTPAASRMHPAIRPLLRSRIFAAVIAVGMMAAASWATPPSPQNGSLPETIAPLLPPAPGITGEGVFAELVKHNELRNGALRQYSAVRTYAVKNTNGKLHARTTVRMEFHAPDRKTFVTVSEEGSRLIRSMVLNRLVASESETAAGKKRRDSSISPANYSLDLLGEQQLGPYRCYVVRAVPMRKDKYLFEGNVWIDARDFAIVQIAGHPAKKLSFWISRAEFVRRYQKIGEFWLPLKDETAVDVKLYGKKILTIDHHLDAVNDAKVVLETGRDADRPANSAAPSPE